MTRIDPAALAERLAGNPLARRIVVLEETPSTNLAAKALAAQDAPSGTACARKPADGRARAARQGLAKRSGRCGLHEPAAAAGIPGGVGAAHYDRGGARRFAAGSACSVRMRQSSGRMMCMQAAKSFPASFRSWECRAGNARLSFAVLASMWGSARFRRTCGNSDVAPS